MYFYGYMQHQPHAFVNKLIIIKNILILCISICITLICQSMHVVILIICICCFFIVFLENAYSYVLCIHNLYT